MPTDTMPPETILIAGPTAGGKSALAINLAIEHGAVIINTDSMQVYRQLQIVTARPDASELEQCPHLLYGHRDAAKPYSVAGWLGDAGEVLDELRASGKAALFVGGTGLYFRGLTQGLSPVPSLDPEIRLKWRNFANTDNPASGNVGRSLYDELMARDPAAAKILRPSDHQRLIRALEVIDSTGRSILEWQNDDKGKALISPDGVRKLLLMPERPALHQRINQRFDKMLAQGVLAEVTRFLELGFDPSLPAMKAIGVPQIASYLKGEVSLDEAIEKAKAATRQFAKRQSTWFSNQFGDDWKRI